MTDAARAALDAAFAAEALPNLPHVARFARMLTGGNQSDADDLVQETFLRAYKAWPSYRPGGMCRSWLFTICRNSYLREAGRRSRVVSLEAPAFDAEAAASNYLGAAQRGPDLLLDRVALRPALQKAIAALPEQFRNTLVLVDVEGRPYEEAAVALDVPIGTVRSRLFRARRMLQESLLAHAEDAGYRARAAG